MPPSDTQRQRILPLSPDAIAQIHSSKHITTLQGVILSLLENCLDAASTKVDITVDWKRGSCTIEDNGDGIPPNEFAEDGGLGKMYCTSKPSPASTHLHGSNGTFLAELSSMSLLTISSTHSSNKQSASLTFHMAKCITRSLPESTQAQSTLPARPGTHIAVRDLFGNMPVRLKHRALATSAPSSDETSWQDLKRGVVALLLAWPKPCSVKLRDATSASKSSASTYDPTDVLPILFQSGFTSPDSRSSWVPLSANTSAISLKGMICQDPAPTKQCQFLSLGVMPCGAADGHGEWYDCVNRIFANSGFGIDQDDGVTPSKKEDREDGRPTRQTAKDKPRKGVDRYPMFCLQLQFKEVPGRISDPSRLNEASLKVVEDILGAAVTAWLEAHHFRPRKKRSGRRRNEEQESPARAMASRQNTGSRMTSSLPTTPVVGKVHRVSSRTGIVMPLASESRADSSRPATRGQKVVLDAGSLSSAGRPLSLSRRGVLAAKSAIQSRPGTAPPLIPTSGSDSGGVAGGTAKTPVEEQGLQEKWLPGFLREWNNPVFALRKEPPIPTASNHGPGILLPTVGSSHHACRSHADGTNPHSVDKGIALSRSALKHARIIAQVDRKFILAVLPATVPSISSSAGTFELPGPSQSDTLVLMDQHAASERVMLEDLLVDLCIPAPAPKTQRVQTVPLESTLEFDIPSSEQAVLEKFRAWFLRWGIAYSLNKKAREARLKISHLPPCIAARCQKEPRLAIELVRGEVWRVAEHGVPKMADIGRDAARESPCRSAIMFNDILDHAACEELVRKLARCVFPFVCAHGRVGVVPVGALDGTRLAVDRGLAGNEESDGKGPGERLASWVKGKREVGGGER
ncbi:uncharacterized protein MYCGRDRAFT_50452 [Zymoseptoria tritici IPO323]|uniref:MutL C-terminal dimerisation domain-containing protein n=1 Tax=Zymoseptoria tritici (strain CBS 115943 / IPO323) TaxID=336722 RepID=F9XNN7_ZYMTI|nr:uncharacterized protein MYCGRDRAFT_50452 [Zymoseptoria tritici IPO323]EGP83135.1 hypothetical protein MYCGRDRAFT_50452 [Zymoseptoria tritici IPO323]